jgi:DNA-binding NarL/FixJ family response regulator
VLSEYLTMQTRVMLVDDHTDFRDIMSASLGRELDLEVVAHARSLAEARSHAAVVTFDVAVLTWASPMGMGRI